MGNTTFNGPVRSENGFSEISIDSSTGVVTDLNRTKTIQATSGTIAVTKDINYDISLGTQPAGTVLNDLIVYNAGAIVTAGASGDDLDISVGTASGGAELLAATALLDDGGSAVTWAANTPLRVIENGHGHAANQFVVGVGPHGGPATTEAITPAASYYSSADRSVYVRFTSITHDLATAATTIKVTAIFKYV
jgi:hypothetical protein